MPSRPCKHPTCTNYVPLKFSTRYCREHDDERRDERRQRDRYYDQHARDPEAKRFYNSSIWKATRAVKLASFPVCQRCNLAWAEHVHHRIPLAKCTPEQRTHPENLMAVCPPCHGEIEAEERSAA